MGATLKLAGALPTSDFVRQKLNQEHWSEEEEEASSPRGFSWTESKPRARFAVENMLGLGEIPNAIT